MSQKVTNKTNKTQIILDKTQYVFIENFQEKEPKYLFSLLNKQLKW